MIDLLLRDAVLPRTATSVDLAIQDGVLVESSGQAGPRRTLVVRGGRVVGRTEPARTTVPWDGTEQEVTFLR